MLFAGCQNSTAAINTFHCCSIRTKLEVNLADVCGFDTRRAPRNCSRFVCWWYTVFIKTSQIQYTYPYFCTTAVLGLQYVSLAIILSDSGERMHRDKIPPQQMNAACMYVVPLHGGHIVPSALRSSTATVKAFVVWNNSWSRCYAQHVRENLLPVLIFGRQKATPEDTSTDHQICCIVGGALGLELVGGLKDYSNYLALFLTHSSRTVDC